MPIIGEGTADGQAIAANDHGYLITAFLTPTLNGANAAHLLFLILFGMTICLVDWFGCFPGGA
jgi:hypothetical protein